MDYQVTQSRLKKLGDPIWERLYMVGIRMKDTYSDEELRHFGLPTTGDARLDQQVHNDLIDRYVTINQMTEWFKNGIPFWVKNHKDTKEIYEVISGYLQCWKEYLDDGINIGGAPIEDLIDLDRLASKVYDHAVEHFTEEYIESKLLRYMNKFNFGRDAFSRKTETVTINADEKTEVKKHNSFATLFSERVFGGR